jgi:hypothetical protein
MVLNYVQAHHLDLEFYDRFFRPGAYLGTHAEHQRVWHGDWAAVTIPGRCRRTLAEVTALAEEYATFASGHRLPGRS